MVAAERLAHIVGTVQGYHPKADASILQEAFRYAELQHQGQQRKSGDPYFVHPVAVASIIAEMKLDVASVCAALLHDVVEDTETTDEEIAQRFGDEVSFLVSGVTKLGRLNFTCREDQQAESFRKMLVAMAKDIRVLLVKLADRLDNMRTLEHMKLDSQERIAHETMDVYAQLAGRLGIHWMKAELEDLSFGFLDPNAYGSLRREVKRASRAQHKYIEDVSKRLQKMLIERAFGVEVTGRVKHLFSIHRKMLENNIEFDQVLDVVAFRVITETVADCYATLGVIHSQWTPIPGSFKDYIALPKPNRYQSLHTTVIGPGRKRIEVQIRTREMHQTAEYGIAAHWKYKAGTGGLDRDDVERFAWLRQLVELQDEVPDPAEFFDEIKGDLFPEEIYVFTPKGDVKTFPRGSTPVDFAFAVHSEVGEHCVGARVNGAIAPLRQRLENGDVIEILSSANQRPNKDWLEFVRTGRARTKIRNFIRREERRRSVEIGKDLLEKAMHRHDLSLTRCLKEGRLNVAFEPMRVGSIDELYAQIGYGRVHADDVAEVIHPKDDAKQASSLRPNFLERTVRKMTRRDDDGIVIDGIHDVMVRFGKCCSPLPGDVVTGWITRGRGVTVHRRGCSRSLELDPERRIEVNWATGVEIHLPVSVRVVTSDRPGILAHVSAAFNATGVNILEANCRTSDDGRAINVFQFMVGDVGKLRNLMRTVMRVDGVLEVQRV